jgi:hypothetical protein
MGWNSGAEIADRVWRVVRRRIPKRQREEVARAIVEIFEGEDCDTMLETEVGEAAGIVHEEGRGSRFAWQR